MVSEFLPKTFLKFTLLSTYISLFKTIDYQRGILIHLSPGISNRTALATKDNMLAALFLFWQIVIHSFNK